MEIFYKQDAINKLSEILKKNYYCKNVLVMISKGVKDKILPSNLKTKEDVRNTLYDIFGEDKVKGSKLVGIEFNLVKSD